jgi:hypothetical protein
VIGISGDAGLDAGDLPGRTAHLASISATMRRILYPLDSGTRINARILACS